MIIIQSLKLGYQNIPKVATTSLFAWLYQCITGTAGRYDPQAKGRKRLQRHYFMGGSEDVITVENTESAICNYRQYCRFALTRDPIKRFLSAYSNRVVYHRELSENAPCANRLVRAGMTFDPQINELVTHFDEYQKAANKFKHHVRPMIHFLGPDLSVYNRIADISEVGSVINEIKAYWTRAGMIDLLERAPSELGRLQTGGPKLGLEVLSANSFERLLNYYSEDYERIPTASLKAIKDEFMKARVAASTVAPILFPALGRRRGGVPKKRPEAAGIIANKQECPLVQTIRIRVTPAAPRAKAQFAVKGVVLLRSDTPADRWELLWSDGKNERRCEWGLPSPRLGQKFPDHPLAPRSKFRVSGMRLAADAPAELYLQDGHGNRHLLLRVKVAV